MLSRSEAFKTNGDCAAYETDPRMMTGSPSRRRDRHSAAPPSPIQQVFQYGWRGDVSAMIVSPAARLALAIHLAEQRVQQGSLPAADRADDGDQRADRNREVD